MPHLERKHSLATQGLSLGQCADPGGHDLQRAVDRLGQRCLRDPAGRNHARHVLPRLALQDARTGRTSRAGSNAFRPGFVTSFRRLSHDIATMEHTRFGFGPHSGSGRGRSCPGADRSRRRPMYPVSHFRRVRPGIRPRDFRRNRAFRFWLRLIRSGGLRWLWRDRHVVLDRLWPEHRPRAADDHFVSTVLRHLDIASWLERLETSGT